MVVFLRASFKTVHRSLVCLPITAQRARKLADKIDGVIWRRFCHVNIAHGLENQSLALHGYATTFWNFPKSLLTLQQGFHFFSAPSYINTGFSFFNTFLHYHGFFFSFVFQHLLTLKQVFLFFSIFLQYHRFFIFLFQHLSISRPRRPLFFQYGANVSC